MKRGNPTKPVPAAPDTSVKLPYPNTKKPKKPARKSGGY